MGLVLMVAAIIVVQREMRHLHWADIRHALAGIPAATLWAGAGMTVLSYVVLSFYDWLAVRQIGRTMPFRRTAFAAFCSYVLSHNLGFSAISGAAVRFRLYGNWGLRPLEVAQIIAFCSATYLLGAAVLIGGVLLWEPEMVPVVGARVPHLLLEGVGLLLWGGVALYILLGRRLNEVTLWRWTITFPSSSMAVAQTVVSAAEVAATAAIAYIFLPDAPGLGYGVFLAIYIASYTAGLVASVPGGLGVFDGAMMLALGSYMPSTSIITAILIFRLFYYIIPLFLAGVMFAGHELFLRGDAVLLSRKAGKDSPARGPRTARPSVVIRESEADFSVAVATGAVSLCGGVLIALTILDPETWDNAAGRLHTLFGMAGDYLLSLIGVALIGLAIGLSQRVTLAWKVTLGLLAAAAGLTLLRGSPLVIPALMALVAILIAPFRNSYYRHARVLSEPLSFPTIMSLLLLIACVIVLACAGPHDALGGSWWEIMLFASSSGVGRWTMGLAVMLGLLMIMRLIRPGRIAIMPWDGEGQAQYHMLDHAVDAVGVAWMPSGLIVGARGQALLPFVRRGTFLIGLGDPAGNAEDCVSAIWWLRDLAVQEGRQPAFWCVGSMFLSVYNDLGLTAWPLPGPAQEAHSPGVETFYLCARPTDARLLQSLMHN
ncbi:lysylphosphatidylglycerol synthase domain-containing protein [Gluconacetobacter entanii]|uniref:Lysylphosphatidylglycerol synthase domain-containing protein n=3 Tax=Gluconacetobacter entanii TaxID=108528 RepID=A0ABT3K980_9PROT|nr:lysylphosphatidylglycerol synthase domain-containing protein [Gluconacetobacter entanii]MCW4582143.1 lysylphosphatidylglycerol synthase domain-containing protein [Gluconacetobacter entanii]MCW4585498.1 lysylphosphatidylglycerol synthase domain-containing protein [Gluconacetobacter entanii]MCW4588541.1 lysylphosphatidylglycerol synthase domain-containing protein [Gluconacetobacter entanii]MCW4591980.1 lysylphosphatidylglycerol synthase domain-containing protein [Gluconacetobacter entanii]